MRERSMGLLEFQERFHNEEACVDHLFRLRWPHGFVCPRCGCERFSFVSSRRLYQCSACRYQTSITAGTVFHKTRTPIRKWFWMIFMMARQKSGVSILRMQKLLRIGSYRTAWLMGHKIRAAMVDRDSDCKLAGLVKMDAGLLNATKAGQGGPITKDKTKLLIGVEVRGERVGLRFMSHEMRLDSESTECLDKDRIDSKGEFNTINTKGKAAHGGPGMEADRSGIGKLKRVYAAIANMRGNIRGVHHGVSAKHFQRYLSEFCYRLNRRQWGAQLFDTTLADCLATRTVTWADLKI